MTEKEQYQAALTNLVDGVQAIIFVMRENGFENNAWLVEEGLKRELTAANELIIKDAQPPV